MQNVTLDTIWAWVGRECWIPNRSDCFLGLLIDGRRPFVAIRFRNFDRLFRDVIDAVLKTTGLHYYYDVGSRETVVRCSLEGCTSVSVFGTMQADLVDELTRALSEQAPFQSTVPKPTGSDA